MSAPRSYFTAVVGFVRRCVSRTRNLAASSKHLAEFFSGRPWPKIGPGFFFSEFLKSLKLCCRRFVLISSGTEIFWRLSLKLKLFMETSRFVTGIRAQKFSIIVGLRECRYDYCCCCCCCYLLLLLLLLAAAAAATCCCCCCHYLLLLLLLAAAVCHCVLVGNICYWSIKSYYVAPMTGIPVLFSFSSQSVEECLRKYVFQNVLL